jgi:ATP synthase protein I
VPKATSSLSSTSAHAAFAGRNGFEDETEDPPVKRLTSAEAAALQERDPSLSPWRVVAAQLAVGVAVAAAAWLVGGSVTAVSALYGALVVVLPAALMARGTTSALSRLSVVTSAISMLVWAGVKMGASVLMLVLAPRIVQPLSWPALLVALVVCMQVYWFALLWRGRSKN